MVFEGTAVSLTGPGDILLGEVLVVYFCDYRRSVLWWAPSHRKGTSTADNLGVSP